MVKLILPKEYLDSIDDALIFLAGPMKGAPMWQDKAIEIISSIAPNIYLASPSLNLREKYLSGSIIGNSPKFKYQLDWEVHYLDVASKKGAIMFWLPVQVSNMPIKSGTGFHRTYARDTRGELGEWRGCLKYDKSINLVVGGEDDFDGFDVIKRNFLRICPDIKFYSTLEDTCKEAVRLSNLK